MRFRSNPAPRRQARSGHTLVELILVISIIGILAGVAALLILWPVRQYADSGRREVLVTEAESALRRMARDIRTALPHSVRVTDNGAGTAFAIEFLPVLDGSKANTKVGAGCWKYNEQAATGNKEWDILGKFRDAATYTTPGIRLVTNNQGISGNDVYEDANKPVGQTAVITPAALTVTLNVDGACSACVLNPERDHICLLQGATPTNHKFTSFSPNQRMYVVKTPVSYLCDTTAGTITRYDNYAIQPGQPATAADFAAANASNALLVEHVSGCQVKSSASDIRDRGLVTLYLGLTHDDQTVRLVHQVMLDNSQ